MIRDAASVKPGAGWRRDFNETRPHTSLGFRVPADEAAGLSSRLAEELGQGHAHQYAGLAVAARIGGKGFPTLDGYIAAIATVHGFAVATRNDSAFKAAGVPIIDPWKNAGSA